MFFAHAARVLAVLALLVGLAQLALGFSIATGMVGPYDEALARYTTANSSGEVIDRGIYLAVFAIALGTLAEIGLTLRKRMASA